MTWIGLFAVGLGTVALHPLLEGDSAWLLATGAAFWLAGVLFGMRVAEEHLRDSTLPPEGRKLWCCRISFAIFIVMTGGGFLIGKYNQHIPGLGRIVQHGKLPLLIGQEDILWIGYTESYRSLASLPANAPEFAPTSLRFHPSNSPDLPGWYIRRGDACLRHEKSHRTLPWNGAGIIAVMEDLTQTRMIDSRRADIETLLDRFARDWTGGKGLYGTAGCLGSLPAWFVPAMAGLTLFLLATAIHLTAKATMGHGPTAPEKTSGHF